jgi:hypothetical protein
MFDLVRKTMARMEFEIMKGLGVPPSILTGDGNYSSTTTASRTFPNYFGAFTGLKIFPDRYMTERKQVRFPRSKKIRIRRKWAKNLKNWGEVPSTKIWRMGDCLIMHPAMIEKLQRKLPAAY